MEKQLLNRKIYKSIKKMDRQEMEGLIKGYYLQGFHQGFKEGSDSGSEVDAKIEVVQFLNELDVKGIGEKTKEKILQAYRERKFNDEGDL